MPEGKDNVRVLLFDPYKSSRENARRILTQEGYSNTYDTDSFEKVADLLGKNDVDMMVASVDRDAKDYWSLMRGLRHARGARNRFIVSLVLLMDPSEQKIRAMVDAGVDSVQTKPLVVDELKKRLAFFRKTRQPFVVTRDYVGPDRRGEPRPEGQQVPLIPAPNPVQLMAEGKTTREGFRELATRASTLIDNQSALRNGYQLVWLADHVHNAILKDDLSDKTLGYLDQIVKVAAQMPARLQGTPYAPAVELCKQVYRLARELQADPDNPSSKNLELLPELTRAIDRYFGEPSSDLGTTKAIQETINQYMRP